MPSAPLLQSDLTEPCNRSVCPKVIGPSVRGASSKGHKIQGIQNPRRIIQGHFVQRYNILSSMHSASIPTLHAVQHIVLRHFLRIFVHYNEVSRTHVHYTTKDFFVNVSHVDSS
jgi:hypothetical protein